MTQVMIVTESFIEHTSLPWNNADDSSYAMSNMHGV